MHSFWLFFLRKREFSWLLIASLIAVGVWSLLAIPKESSPEVIVPIGIVTTVFPGASALDVEELITNKIEQEVANLDNLDGVDSTSRDGVSLITASFDASADIDKSIQDLKDAVDKVKGDLPRDAQDPLVSEVNFANQPIVILSVSANLPPVAFTELGTALVDEFEGVAGVSEVVVEGTRDRQVQIVLKERALSAYALSVNDVTNALAGANLTLPIGTVLTEGVEYAVRYEGKINAVAEIENIPVGVFGQSPVYVRDIAVVKDGVERESSISRVSLGGAPSESAMTLSMYKRSGYDVTKMADAVHVKLKELQSAQGLLNGSQVLVVFDQGENVKKDLSELVKAGLETVLLVVLTLLLTIGWRESLVAALSIPLSFVIAFIGLYASGNTINFISLFALILAVGILVDSGIVITEAIHTRMRKLNDPSKAAAEAIREYAWPLIAGTMTTVAVFAPLFFLSGITGEFISSIPFTIIFVLIASIVVALGMVPLIAIYLTKQASANRFEEMQEAYTHKVQVWYRRHLVAFLQNPTSQRIFMGSLGVAFIAVFFLPATGLLKVVFFPPENVDFVYVEIETKQGTPVRNTDLIVRSVEEILYDKPYIESFTATAGSGSAFTGSGNSGGKFGNITITLKEDRTESSAEIADDLRSGFAAIVGADIKITEQQNGPPTGAPVVIKFFGDDLSLLALSVEKAERLLSSITGVRDIEVSTDNNATELILAVDTDKAAALGVSPQAIGQMLRTAVYGVTATTITRNGEDIDIVVKLEVDPDEVDMSATPEITLDTLRNLSITSFSGESVLLDAVVAERLAPANAIVIHEDEERVESLSAYTAERVTAAEVVKQFKDRASELELPAGVRISYGGETEDINKSFTEMGLAFVAGLIGMLAILVLSFNSIRYSLYLLLAVPLSLIGVFAGLTLTGLALSFTSLLGVIALAGVIINHAIILMDSMIHHRAAMQPGDVLLDVVADSSVTRLRPIVLTTVTTVIGMIPLSMISDFWSPLAFAIMFGLTFAMILTLVLVPTLFYRHEKRLLEGGPGFWSGMIRFFKFPWLFKD